MILIALIDAQDTQAQIDAFTFFIPYSADILDDQFNEGFDFTQNNNFASNLIDDDIITTIAIAILSDNTIIYYDHWEDGLEKNLLDPAQDTTEIWGDGDPTNGKPPNFPGDILLKGSIVLQNRVPVPRNPNSRRFDGGDKLTAIGGGIAVTRAAWPLHDKPPDSTIEILYAGSWELYPTSRWDTKYLIPVGENLDGIGPNQRPAFEVVGLNVQAAEKNTIIEIDLNNDGTAEHTPILDQGEQFTLIGKQQGLDALQSVLVGTRVESTNDKPIQVHILIANPDESFEARAYTIVPFDQWKGDYIAPRSSDGDYWLYNPNASPLQVTAETFSTTTVITIPANTTFRYSTGVTMSQATGLHFFAAQNFYGVVALDEDSAQDWGYALVPVDNLTTQELIGFGPGNNNPIPDDDESRVYITALQATSVTVRYSDGTTTTVHVPRLAEVPITAPDHDMSGSFLFTRDGTPFIAVWGQDSSADPALPSIDIGTSVVPLPSLALQKTMVLFEDTDNSETITWGDVVKFTLRAYNNTINPLPNGVLEDRLPNTVTYVPGSSTVNNVSISDDITNTTLFPFDEGGLNIGTIPGLSLVTATFATTVNEGAMTIQNFAQSSSPGVTVADPGTVDISIDVARYELDKRLIKPANGTARPGDEVQFGVVITSTGNISITVLPLKDTYIEEHLTFQTAQPFSPDAILPGEVVWSDLARADRFGPLPPGRAIALTVTFILNEDIPQTVTTTLNVATVSGALGIDGAPLPSLSDTARIFIPDPPPDSDDGGGSEDPPPISQPPPDDVPPPPINPPDSDSPTPTPFGTPPPVSQVPTPTFLPGTGTPSVTPPPLTLTPGTGTPATVGAPTATVFPVALLPETGQRPASPMTFWTLLVLSTLGVWIFRIMTDRHHQPEASPEGSDRLEDE